MSEMIILGSSNALPAVDHHNTQLLFQGNNHLLLIDCGENPLIRMEQAKLKLNDLTDIILTHFHPDHVSGFPLFLMNLWLLGRKKTLTIYGLNHTLERLEALMGFFHWEDWPDFFQVNFSPIPEEENWSVFTNDDFRVYSSPVEHLVPAIGVRVEFRDNEKSITYSCDTEPCTAVVNMAAGSDILIHEASGPFPGHTSASQAGEIAEKAGVKKLLLIHYPTRGEIDNDTLLQDAQESFSGDVELALDMMVVAP
jgi:ribonuclease Z